MIHGVYFDLEKKLIKAEVENNRLKQENKRLQMENDHLKRLQQTVLPVLNFGSLQNRGFPDAINVQAQSRTIEPGFAPQSIQIDEADLADQLENTQRELQQTQVELRQTKTELKLMQEKVHTDMSRINQLFAFL